MENQNLNQGERQNELKIGITRDGRSIIFRLPGLEGIFFKPVAYMEKVIESAKKRQASATVNAEAIKD